MWKWIAIMTVISSKFFMNFKIKKKNHSTKKERSMYMRNEEEEKSHISESYALKGYS